MDTIDSLDQKKMPAAPTENVEAYEDDLFILIYEAIPYYVSSRTGGDSLTADLMRDKGTVLVKLLNVIRERRANKSEPYTYNTARLFSVKKIVLSDRKKSKPYELTQIIFPPVPEPQKKFTSCLRAYICYDKNKKTYRFVTVETNKMFPSYVLCEAKVGSHGTLHFFDPCTPEQDIAEIAKELGDPELYSSDIETETVREWDAEAIIKELEEAKEEVLVIYEKEKSKVGRIIKNPIRAAEVKHIEKELNKIDSLISFLKRDDIEYVVMKLERLYMQLLSDMTKEEFEKLSSEKQSNIFLKLFPIDWYRVPIEEKREYLLDAIIDNKRITF